LQKEKLIREYLNSRALRETTKKLNSFILSSFLEFIDKEPEKIKKKDIYNYFTELRERGCKESYIALNTKIIRSFLKWLADVEVIDERTCRKLLEPLNQQLKRGKEIVEPNYLEENEIRRLVKACKTKIEETVIPLLLATGMRVSELCKLRLGDVVDWDNNVIRVRGKRGHVMRIRVLEKIPGVPVMTKLKAWIAYKGIRNKDDRLFPYTTKYIWKVVKRVAKRAKIQKNIHPHVLRHTTAVWMLEHGYTIEHIRRQLRHMKITTTQIYTALTEKDYFRATEKHLKVE